MPWLVDAAPPLVIAGLGPATPLSLAPPGHMIGVAWRGPAMTFVLRRPRPLYDGCPVVRALRASRVCPTSVSVDCGTANISDVVPTSSIRKVWPSSVWPTLIARRLPALRLAAQRQQDADEMLHVLDAQAEVDRALCAALDAQPDGLAVVGDLAEHIEHERRRADHRGIDRYHETLPDRCLTSRPRRTCRRCRSCAARRRRCATTRQAPRAGVQDARSSLPRT
jgi:hypothetical protein